MSYNEKYVYKRNVFLSLYIVSYNEKYTFMYNRNVCCHYTSSRITRYALSCIKKYLL